MMFPDGISQYVGQFRGNNFHGTGNLQLKCEGAASAKHNYSGSFKEGRLDGMGSFTHGLTNEVFGPDFVNNHFLANPPIDPH
jgi:hypothetical protein